MNSQPSSFLVSSEDMPLTIMPLEDWALVQITGLDSCKYLQGQLTIDIEQLDKNTHQICGHCDSNGKLWGILRIFSYQEGYRYIIRRSAIKQQLAALKKYSIFSKIHFSESPHISITALAGDGARENLNHYFPNIPDKDTLLVTGKNYQLLYLDIPAPRYLILWEDQDLSVKKIISCLSNQAHLANSLQWLSLDIEAGIPTIDDKNCAKFIPQSVNLNALGGISFKKGCYIGQEIIARTEYRGVNKKALYWLQSTTHNNLTIGHSIELKIGEKLRSNGTILAITHLNKGYSFIQAVVNQPLKAGSLVQLRENNEQLQVNSLPYFTNN